MLAVTSCLVPFLLLAPFSVASSVYFNNVLREEDSPCPADAEGSWSYRGQNGPKYWGQTYPQCNGNSQSPINIVTADVVKNPDLGKLRLVNYDKPVSSAKLLNNGHTIKITPTDDVERTMEVDGSIYRLAQLHCHWGNRSDLGSEHTIDGRSYVGEVHLVHVNENNQLSVIGVLYIEGGECHPDHLEIAQNLPIYKNEETQLNKEFTLTDLLPENTSSFYRYQGSLTTPPCSEGVTWTVLKYPQTACSEEMKLYREVHSDTRDEDNDACHIDNNYRCTQPLNGRVVYQSQ